MIEKLKNLHKNVLFWISIVVLCTVTIPQSRDKLWQWWDVAKASEVNKVQQEKEKQDTLFLQITLEIFKTQNKILDAIADSSSGMDSLKQKIYLDMLKEQLDSLKRLLPEEKLK